MSSVVIYCSCTNCEVDTERTSTVWKSIIESTIQSGKFELWWVVRVRVHSLQTNTPSLTDSSETQQDGTEILSGFHFVVYCSSLMLKILYFLDFYILEQNVWCFIIAYCHFNAANSTLPPRRCLCGCKISGTVSMCFIFFRLQQAAWTPASQANPEVVDTCFRERGLWQTPSIVECIWWRKHFDKSA